MGTYKPLSIIPKEQLVRLYNTYVSAARQAAHGLIDARELVVRPLKPKDLGLASDEWTFNVNAGENTIINTQLDDKTLVLIVGFFNLSTNPQVVELIFGTPAKTIEDVYFEDIYMYSEPAALLDEPISYQPGGTAIIKAVAKGANTAEKLGFIGFVVEPAGRTIGSS